MYPLKVTNIPKISDEDTTLTFGNANGEKRTIPVPKGTRIIINTPGLHYNRKESKTFLGENLFWTDFSPFLLCTSSLLERSSHFQTWTFLGRLAKRCIPAVQCWWVVNWQWSTPLFHQSSILPRSTGPRACLGRKWVVVLPIYHP